MGRLPLRGAWDARWCSNQKRPSASLSRFCLIPQGAPLARTIVIALATHFPLAATLRHEGGFIGRCQHSPQFRIGRSSMAALPAPIGQEQVRHSPWRNPDPDSRDSRQKSRPVVPICPRQVHLRCAGFLFLLSRGDFTAAYDKGHQTQPGQKYGKPFGFRNARLRRDKRVALQVDRQILCPYERP